MDGIQRLFRFVGYLVLLPVIVVMVAVLVVLAGAWFYLQACVVLVAVVAQRFQRQPATTNALGRPHLAERNVGDPGVITEKAS